MTKNKIMKVVDREVVLRFLVIVLVILNLYFFAMSRKTYENTDNRQILIKLEELSNKNNLYFQEILELKKKEEALTKKYDSLQLVKQEPIIKYVQKEIQINNSSANNLADEFKLLFAKDNIRH